MAFVLFCTAKVRIYKGLQTTTFTGFRKGCFPAGRVDFRGERLLENDRPPETARIIALPGNSDSKSGQQRLGQTTKRRVRRGLRPALYECLSSFPSFLRG